MPLKTYESINRPVRVGNSFSLTTGIKLETNHKGVSVIIATVFPSHAFIETLSFHDINQIRFGASVYNLGECDCACVFVDI